MKVFILGGTGFIGRQIVRQLAAGGHEVAVFHRGNTPCEFPATVRELTGDRQDADALAGAAEQFRPDVALDVIPYTEAQAQNLVTAFRGRAQRLVALSSIDVYRNYDGLRRVGNAPPDPTPLPEDAPLREHLYPYRATCPGPEHLMYHYEKILVEQTVLGQPDLPGTVLRLPMVYGPHDRQHRLHASLRRMDDGRPAILFSEGQAAWSWARGYVENVAAAVALALVNDRAAGRVYNVAEPETLTEAEWVQRVGQAVGWTGTVVALPEAHLPPGLASDLDWRYHLNADTSRLRAELGFTEIVSQAEALRRTIAWERANPPEGAEAPDYAAEDAALAAAG